MSKYGPRFVWKKGGFAAMFCGRTQANRRYPAFEYPFVSPGRDMFRRMNSAWEQAQVWFKLGFYDPRADDITRLLGQFELYYWSLRLLLHDPGTRHHAIALPDIAIPKLFEEDARRLGIELGH